MTPIWFGAGAAVAAVAGMKTALVLHLVPGGAGWGLTGALFGGFFAMTAAVGLIALRVLKPYLESQRKLRAAQSGGTPVAKESVIASYAADWGLSQAEADVAMFVAKGFSNSEIAEMRGSSVATVKSQLGAIYQKSGLGSRYQLIGFVTDEVCASIKDDAAPAARPVRKVLPLVGRSARRAANAEPALRAAQG